MQSYSWEGEDVLVRKLMRDIFKVVKGFYVDIGAHHPVNLSNTALLYSEGWRGINIDATPGSMDLFVKHRPDDINLEVAIGPQKGSRSFYCFANPALNGFHSELSLARHLSRGNSVVQQIEVKCVPINDVLSEHVSGRNIDLLTIDVEGLDCEILESLDIKCWEPTLIVAEVLGAALMADVINSDIYQLLEGRGYALFSRLHFSTIFVSRNAYAAAAIAARGNS
jgi:FkbM family methyltransferase